MAVAAHYLCKVERAVCISLAKNPIGPEGLKILLQLLNPNIKIKENDDHDYDFANMEIGDVGVQYLIELC